MSQERELRTRSSRSWGPRLVGRRAVLDLCSSWLRAARAGDARFVAIEGPPGIGKTAVLSELLREADDEGARVFSGACREEATIPYLPLATALAPLFETGGGGPFARFPGLGRGTERDPEPSIEAMGAHREDELALYLEITDSLNETARERPVVLALDDLHWADDPTMVLLGHLVASVASRAVLEPAPFLIVATLRPDEGSAAVRRGITRMGREPGARRVTLGGLDELETNELLVRLAPHPPSPRLLEFVMDATNGNPMTIRLLLERLLETGDAFVENGRLTCGPHEELAAMPIELDDALRDVLDHISPPALQLLTDAALLGDGASVSEIVAVSTESPEAIEPLLDELDDARVLSCDDTHCRFAHPQLRRIASQLPTPRRRHAAHRRLADRLELHYDAAAEDHAMAIAGHLERAGPLVDPPRLCHWAMLAGNQAFVAGAWSEAARHYDSAIGADPASADARRYFVAALGHHRNHDIPACLERLERAVTLARAAGDLEVWASSVALAARARSAHSGGAVGTMMDLAPFEEFLEHTGEQVPELRCQLLAQMSEACFAAFDSARGMPLAEQALHLARALDDDLLVSLGAFAVGLHHLAELEFDDAARQFAESAARARSAGDAWYEPLGTIRLGLVDWTVGELTDADTVSAEGGELARRVADWAEYSLATSCRVGRAVAHGSYAEAERLGDQAEQAYLRSAYAFTPPLLYSCLAWARAQRGDLDGAAAALGEWERSEVPGADVFRILCQALVEGTATGLDDFGALIDGLRVAPPNLFTTGYVAALAQAADLADAREVAAALAEPLAELTARGMRFCPFGSLFVPRLAALAAFHGGDLERADVLLAAAESQAAVSPVALAETRMDRARVALARRADDPQAVRALLLTAASTFDGHGMLPMLARAQALAAPLIAEGTTLPASTRYLLVTDIVGSTGLNLEAGDQRWIELIREHNQVVKERLRDHDGVQFKHTGDGICAWFSSAGSAVRCALDMIVDFDRHNLLHPQLPVRIRCGVASGAPIGEGDDLFGISVALASRLCSAAGTNEVLVADDVARAAQGRGLVFGAIETVVLKGFPGDVAVRRASPDTSSVSANSTP
jgi:class 3 adenylate cyclase